MAKPKQTDEELLASLANLGADDDSLPTSASQQHATTGSTTATADDEDDDPLADLLIKTRASATISRPDTPQHLAPSSTATSVTGRGRHTPPSSGRNSNEDQQSARVDDSSAAAATTPKPASASASAPSDKPAAPAAGSWWGGFSAIVSTARKQAETALQEIQKHEEANKWAEQVRGNLGAVRGLVGSHAIPTFTSLLHTLAPPISQHERLQIHITHDLSHYPALDPLIYATFSRVMAQVEGGDLMVIQRGSEATQKRDASTPTAANTTSSSNSANWSDGPWWRDTGRLGVPARSIGAVRGLTEGTKLARASAESHATEFFAARGGLEEAAKRQADAALSDTNPVRSSDIFLAIQAIAHTELDSLFASGGPQKEKHSSSPSSSNNTTENNVISFAIYLDDPMHSIAYSALSQPIPQQWIDWLDAAPTSSPDKTSSENNTEMILPDAIAEVINTGGVDPREWVAEWVEEVLGLAVGVAAQRYVARRMGVGDGGLGRGRKRVQDIVEDGGGEVARAL